MQRPAPHTWLLWLALTFWIPALVAEDVTLNLKNADIEALISTVSEITGSNFIVDPRVKGKVTVVSSRPMKAEEVYEVFQSVLKVHGFATVPAGDVIKIVPDVNAKQESIITVDDQSRPRGDEMVTRVVQVDNVSAAQLVPILRPLVPQQGHLAAYPGTNVLIISDGASNIERLVQIIERIDQQSDSEIEVIPLQHASAAEVVRVLNALSPGGGAPRPGVAPGEGGGSTLIADERTNSVLLGGALADRLRMRTLITHLDTPLERGGNITVVYLKYAKAADLAPVLKGVGASQAADGQKAPGVTPGNSTNFDIQADETTNALVITAPPDVTRSLQGVISQLDVRRAQVLVEAVIAEVSTDKTRELGMQWLFAGATDGSGPPVGIFNFDNASGGKLGIAGLASAIKSGSIPSTGIPSGAAIGGGKISETGSSVVAVINALANDANTNLLSTPTLITLDNEEAEIVIGQNVPFVTGSFTNTGASDSATNPFQTIQRQDVGLTLKIKPQINEGSAIKMDIQQEVSSVAESAISGAADLITNKRSIKTSVMVEDGQVIVLGGLIEDKIRENQQKVPLLGDLPLFGQMFRSNTVTKGKTNLMVFIHPVILQDEAVTAQYTTGKYNYIRAQQLEQDQRRILMMRKEQRPILPTFEDFVELPPPFAEADAAVKPATPDNTGETPPVVTQPDQTPPPATPTP